MRGSPLKEDATFNPATGKVHVDDLIAYGRINRQCADIWSRGGVPHTVEVGEDVLPYWADTVITDYGSLEVKVSPTFDTDSVMVSGTRRPLVDSREFENIRRFDNARPWSSSATSCSPLNDVPDETLEEALSDRIWRVFEQVEPEPEVHPSTQRFLDVLDDMRALHEQKGADYGTGADPFANVRATGQFGIPAWLGAVIRLNDKVARIKSFAQKGTLANESVEDSLRDMAVYAAIALVLYWERDIEGEE